MATIGKGTRSSSDEDAVPTRLTTLGSVGIDGREVFSRRWACQSTPRTSCPMFPISGGTPGCCRARRTWATSTSGSRSSWSWPSPSGCREATSGSCCFGRFTPSGRRSTRAVDGARGCDHDRGAPGSGVGGAGADRAPRAAARRGRGDVARAGRPGPRSRRRHGAAPSGPGAREPEARGRAARADHRGRADDRDRAQPDRARDGADRVGHRGAAGRGR